MLQFDLIQFDETTSSSLRKDAFTIIDMALDIVNSQPKNDWCREEQEEDEEHERAASRREELLLDNMYSSSRMMQLHQPFQWSEDDALEDLLSDCEESESDSEDEF